MTKELIEHIAESDDSSLEKNFEQGTLSEDELRAGIHAAIHKRTICPLFTVSSMNNIWVTRVLDFVAKYGASPVDRMKVDEHNEKGEVISVAITDERAVAYVFKTMGEEHVGEMSFFRVYSGVVRPGIDLYTVNRRCNERFGQLFQLNGKSRTTAPALHNADYPIGAG